MMADEEEEAKHVLQKLQVSPYINVHVLLLLGKKPGSSVRSARQSAAGGAACVGAVTITTRRRGPRAPSEPSGRADGGAWGRPPARLAAPQGRPARPGKSLQIPAPRVARTGERQRTGTNCHHVVWISVTAISLAPCCFDTGNDRSNGLHLVAALTTKWL
jgi:hypothetical protein